MKSIGLIITAIAAAFAIVSCAGEGELCRRYRTETSINQSGVPEGLRGLIPLALKWGAGDPALRDALERSMTSDEWRELRESIHGKTAEIEEWLDAARKSGRWTAEACAFRFLLEFYDDMKDLQLMKALKKQ
ncbi:MAG TPA: hypothetical protein PLM53_11090 [Spirochaetota bacterium]|nr:hypothetical protein [Spirochaetota bacterium]HPC41493.1 hypothetical protein [Spirochaetota bacterium]HPL15620.1 hypothetical protein [Spirochaetota bacterium]HQF09139.1 hypothetical protein [Spirochaetota bacterium]HQH97636.1 hypothetical protein [Spirochaetota bacterium]